MKSENSLKPSGIRGLGLFAKNPAFHFFATCEMVLQCENIGCARLVFEGINQ